MCAHVTGPTQPALSGIRSEVPGVGGGRANKDAKKCSLVRPWERGLNAQLLLAYMSITFTPLNLSPTARPTLSGIQTRVGCLAHANKDAKDSKRLCQSLAHLLRPGE